MPKVLAHMSKKMTRGPAPYRMHSGVEPQPGGGAQNLPPPPQEASYGPPPPDGYLYSPPLADGAPPKGGMPFPPSPGGDYGGGNQYYVNQGGYQPPPPGGRYSPMPTPPPHQQQYYAPPPRPGPMHQGSSFHMQNQGGPYVPVNGYAPQGPYGVDYPAHGGPPGKEKTKTSRFSSAGSRFR